MSTALALAAGLCTVALPVAAAAASVLTHRPVRAVVAPFQAVRELPASASLAADGRDPLVVTFDRPLASQGPLPTVTPAVPGTWTRTRTSLEFTPRVAFLPNTVVTVRVPGGSAGVRAADGAHLTRPVAWEFGTRTGSMLRVQQILATLGYLPLRFKPAHRVLANRLVLARALWSAPAGTLSLDPGMPATLRAQWVRGQDTVMLQGALTAFEFDHGLAIGGPLDSADWAALLAASLRPGAYVNAAGYSYALVSKASPETLTIWHDGKVVLSTPANTGIAVTPTNDGTFPVYERLATQVMQGTNPDGTHYADPVSYVAYFNGGDAVHYIYRASYGYPQSLGCVELPLAAAATAYNYLLLGTLVTVVG